MENLILLFALSILTTACGFSEAYQKALANERAMSGQRTAQQQAMTPHPTATGVGESAMGKDVVHRQETTWSMMSTELHTSISALAIDSLAPNTVYAVGVNGIFKSTDSGAKWSAINTGIYNREHHRTPSIRTLAIDPQAPNTLYAGAASYGHGVYKSTNGGANWSAINNGLDFGELGSPNIPEVVALVIDPQISNTLYIQTFRGIFKSTNGGASWNAVNAGYPVSRSELTSGIPRISSLAIDPQDSSTVYAGTFFHGLFKSTDGGARWNAVNTGLTAVNRETMVYALSIDPKTPSTVYVGTNRDGVFKSTNGGTSWYAINTGLTPADLFVRTLTIDPQDPNMLYAGTASGVFQSTNGGASWTKIKTESTGVNVWSLVLDPRTPRVVYAGTEKGVLTGTSDGTLK